MRATGAPVLLVDTGSMFYRPTENPLRRIPLIEERSDFILQALEEMDYDAVNIGWLDPLLPAEMLLRFDEKTSFPFLGANTRDEKGGRPFTASVVREYDGFRVGLFGLVSSQMPGVPGVAGRSFKVSDFIDEAGKTVRELRESCDIVVALTSLGVENDARLAREVPGIDIILGGLDRRVLYQARIEKGTVIVQAGSKGMRLGRLDLEFLSGAKGGWTLRGGGMETPKTFSWNVVALGSNIPDEPRIAARLDDYHDALKEKEIAARMARPAGAVSPYAGVEACRSCHAGAADQWVKSPHAAAFSTLVAGGQDGNPDCLRCHTTAFGAAGGYRPGGTVDLRGVQCEACHGPGRRHRGSGFIRIRVPEGICHGCHNEENSPEFQYEPYLKKLAPHGQRYFQRRN